jgi:hypothetical protein
MKTVALSEFSASVTREFEPVVDADAQDALLSKFGSHAWSHDLSFIHVAAMQGWLW